MPQRSDKARQERVGSYLEVLEGPPSSLETFQFRSRPASKQARQACFHLPSFFPVLSGMQVGSIDHAFSLLSKVRPMFRHGESVTFPDDFRKRSDCTRSRSSPGARTTRNSLNKAVRKATYSACANFRPKHALAPSENVRSVPRMCRVLSAATTCLSPVAVPAALLELGLSQRFGSKV